MESLLYRNTMPPKGFVKNRSPSRKHGRLRRFALDASTAPLDADVEVRRARVLLRLLVVADDGRLVPEADGRDHDGAGSEDQGGPAADRKSLSAGERGRENANTV